MGLSKYKQKRDFDSTPEPTAKKGTKKKALSFVVQRHDATRLHYDLRLEMEGVLKSWAIPKGPSMKIGDKRLAVMVEDHPLDYGQFYGEIPEGNYGAGVVDIWDSGTYTAYKAPDNTRHEKQLLDQLQKGDLKFVLNGTHLKGAFALVRIKGDDNNNWLLIKKKDGFDLPEFDIESIKPIISAGLSKKKKTGTRTRPPIPTDALSKSWESLREPMLATLTGYLKNEPDWFYEMKYDGYRALTMIDEGRVEMLSRNANSFNEQFKPLIKELEKIKDQVILDGEVVLENEKGISDFQQLQNYIRTQKGSLRYYVFDLLFLNEHKIVHLPLRNRKELLEEFMNKYSFKNIISAPYIIGKGEELLLELTSKGYEGVIAKDPESEYLPGKRTRSWLKVKPLLSHDAIICGYTLPQKSRKYFGSLILGMYENNQLVHIGNCGTGFSDASLKELHKRFQPLITNNKPFELKGSRNIHGKPIWIKPQLVCGVRFLTWTQDKQMRHPSFLGLRTDAKKKEIVMESTLPSSDETQQVLTIGRKKVKVTNLNKLYWPDENITKGDLIRYYESISTFILPYLKNRPQSLNRFPSGIKGPSFYHKDMEVSQLPSWVKTSKLYSKSNDREIDYLICNDVATLIYMANMGCIEINPWHSTYAQPDYPDYLILDLDPGKISFTEVVNTALVVKEICDELSIECYCKTSGATGMHVYIPLGAKYDYDQVKTFAEIMATITHGRIPSVTSIERMVAKRKDKIYVDFLQNRKGQTIAAPYSVRPQPLATVSTPLKWDEVNHQLTPQQFTIHNTEQRLSKVGDIWKGVLGKPINLLKVLKLLEKLN